MRTKSIIRLSAIALSIYAISMHSSCYKDNKASMYPSSATCDTTTVTWTSDIQPLVNNSCATSGCHDASGAGGYALNNYAGVKTMVDNQRFITVMVNGTMPRGGATMDACSINKVRAWINRGALQN
jgi:hypothetical protein